MQRMTLVGGNKIGHRSPALRDSAAYAFDQAAPMSRGSLLPFPAMLRFISATLLVGACCSSVLPLSAFFVLSALAAETLKQLNPDADKVS